MYACLVVLTSSHTVMVFRNEIWFPSTLKALVSYAYKCRIFFYLTFGKRTIFPLDRDGSTLSAI